MKRQPLRALLPDSGKGAVEKGGAED